jgi:hypothetical protein
MQRKIDVQCYHSSLISNLNPFSPRCQAHRAGAEPTTQKQIGPRVTVDPVL